MLCMHFRHVCIMFFCVIHQDVLGQDMFLLGPPGPLRRHLALAYCELTGREMEYVSLSRDTTETDLNQRREIVAGTVHYVDQVSMCVSVLCFTYSSVLYTFLSFLHTCIFTNLCIYMYNVAPVCELHNIRHGL